MRQLLDGQGSVHEGRGVTCDLHQGWPVHVKFQFIGTPCQRLAYKAENIYHLAPYRKNVQNLIYA